MHRDGGEVVLSKVVVLFFFVLFCFASFYPEEYDGGRTKGVKGACSDTRWSLN